MREVLKNLTIKARRARDTEILGLPAIDIVVLALPVIACAALLVSFVARYGEYFPQATDNERAPLLVSASLPSNAGLTQAEGAPYVGTPHLRPSFGLGAFSAETDRLPDGTWITPVPSLHAPGVLSVASASTTPFIDMIPSLDARSAVLLTNPDPTIRPAPRPLDLVVLTMAVAPDADSPEFASTGPLTGTSLASLGETADGTTDGVAVEQNPLEAYAVLLSPRPEYRPARLLSAERALAAVQASPSVPESAPAARVQTASVTQPSGPIFTGPSGQTCSRRLTRAIPRRAGRAQAGSAFIASLSASSGGTRDSAIAREAMSGNVPKFMRNLVPVSFTGTLGNGRETTITICVTPDYLAIGSNADYVRVPMGLSAAAQIAEQFDMMLPTTRMVDAIYRQAAVRLSPKPMQAGSQMSSTPYFLRHNATVEQQRRAAGGPLGALVSGHKKDLVLTNRLTSSPGRVAIYGWHRTNGRAIQPLSTVHGAGYADYSHGIRLVSQTAYVDGRATNLAGLLQDRQYAQMLNDRGTIGSPAIRLAGL